MNLEAPAFSIFDTGHSPTISCISNDTPISRYSYSPKECKGKSKILQVRPKDQISDDKYITALFRTDHGYREGDILEQHNHTDYITVLFTRNEYGNKIREKHTVPSIAEVIPRRHSKNTVWLYTTPIKKTNQLYAENYLYSKGPIDTGNGLGAGITGQRKCKGRYKMVKYPIHNPLTLHNSSHKEMLSNASSFISQAVDEYLQTGQISDPILNQTCWLINVVLYVDAHPIISGKALQEALSNFCYDYLNLPEGTMLRQPINYIFNVIAIDGIWSKFSDCISHIPTDFEGVQYSV